jgi:hypothetical protein
MRRGQQNLSQPGEPEHVWWFGFDCAHCDDLCPSHRTPFRSIFDRSSGGDGAYRTVAYVRREVESLAAQLAEFQK